MADQNIVSDSGMDCEDILVNKKLGLGCALDYFKELEEVMKLTGDIRNNTTDRNLEKLLQRYTYIIGLYQEQPHLLDPHLQSILDKLLASVREADSEHNIELQNCAFKLISILASVRAPKVLVRHMPHEVGDLQLVLKLLSQQDPKDKESWQSRCVLLMWLSILVMIPFHMDRLDSDQNQVTTMDKIVKIIEDYLCCNDSAQSAAVMLAGKFFTRPDTKSSHLPQFIDWSLKYLSQEDDVLNQSHKAAILSSLAQLFKHGKRVDVEVYGGEVFKHVIKLNLLEKPTDLIRKSCIKVVQRIGLTFLQAKVATWRYNRGSRSLTANLALSSTMHQSSAANREEEEQKDRDAEADEEYEVPEIIEDIFELLLKGLRDIQTNIRWCAAKGVGRVCGRLPKELADDVIGSVIDLFDMREGDKAWHGGCLALAELGRRGLLVPEHLDRVIPLVVKALVYDELKGNFSVGAHIRDAACYVFWAFARAYDSQVLKPYVQGIAQGLLITAIFDREINCRKAAAAAFQENVGRQGTFPHGIDVVTAVDYFTVALRHNSYLNLSVYVAQFSEYTIPLINHLLDHKLIHWDVEVRQLSSQALHKLTTFDAPYMVSHVLPSLLKMAVGSDMYSRHGAVLSICEIVEALVALQPEKDVQDIIGKEHLYKVREMMFVFNERKVLRGLGGDLLRSALCIFIYKMSKVNLLAKNDWEAIDLWKEILLECLTNIDPKLRSAATSALSQLCQDYYILDKTRNLELVETCLEKLDSYLEPTVCGFTAALGSFPAASLEVRLSEVQAKLLSSTRCSKEDQKMWVQARSSAISSLVNIAQGLGAQHFSQEAAFQLYQCFIEAIDDYTTDSRGDIGSIVRISAIEALKDLTLMFVQSKQLSLLTPELVKNMFCAVLKVSVEKTDKVSSAAGQFLGALLYTTPKVPHIPHRSKLQELLPPGACEKLKWTRCVETFAILVQLLLEPDYTYHLLLGFTLTIGCEIEYFVNCARTCLLTFLTPIKCVTEKRILLETTFLKLFRNYCRDQRLCVCTLTMADFLLSSGLLDETDPNEFPLQILTIGWAATKINKTARRVIAMIDVLCDLINFPGKCRSRSLSSLTVWLCHTYPRIRAVTAQKLYEALVSSVDIVPDEHLEDLLSLLSETNWSVDDKEDLRPVRNQICTYLGINSPLPVVKVDS